jgi:hypothetical protein
MDLCVTCKTGSGLDNWIYWHLVHTNRDYGEYSVISDLHTLQFTVTQALGFSLFTSRILTTDLLQSHCRFKSHMKSSFHSLIPFLPLFCSCQFRKLDSIQFLCSQAHILAACHLETRLSTRFDSTTSKVEVKAKFTLRRSVSQPVLVLSPHLGLITRYLLLFDTYSLVIVGRPLWREDGSVSCQGHCLQ